MKQEKDIKMIVVYFTITITVAYLLCASVIQTRTLYKAMRVYRPLSKSLEQQDIGKYYGRWRAIGSYMAAFDEPDQYADPASLNLLKPKLAQWSTNTFNDEPIE